MSKSVAPNHVEKVQSNMAGYEHNYIVFVIVIIISSGDEILLVFM